APTFDLEARLVGEMWKAPSVLRRAVRVAGRDVDPRDRLGSGGDLRRGGDGERGQLLGVRGLGGDGVGARLDHPARFLMQLGRVETHNACERLAVGEATVWSHELVGVTSRNLDMIAKHRIVPDLQ